jgi:hypothetical protein
LRLSTTDWREARGVKPPVIATVVSATAWAE